MSTDCVISFDHPNGVYNSGNTLNGHVKIQTEKSKSIRGISVKIIGYGKVSWNEGKGINSTNLTSHEQYLNSVTYVIGSEEGNSFNLVPGIYKYTFSCELPIELPTSMRCDNCKVKYKVIITINRPLRFDNVFQKDFMINHITDLNLMEINRLPRRNISVMKIADIFTLCFHDDGNIKAILQVFSDGYVPGQEIPYKLFVCNDSNGNLSGIEVKLLQCCILQSTEPYATTKEFQKELIIKSLNDIPRHSTNEFEGNFHVPRIPPSHRTRFIRLVYKLSAKICSGYVKKFYVEVPVTIGTLPIEDFDPNKPIDNNFYIFKYKKLLSSFPKITL